MQVHITNRLDVKRKGEGNGGQGKRQRQFPWSQPCPWLCSGSNDVRHVDHFLSFPLFPLSNGQLHIGDRDALRSR